MRECAWHAGGDDQILEVNERPLVSEGEITCSPGPRAGQERREHRGAAAAKRGSSVCVCVRGRSPEHRSPFKIQKPDKTQLQLQTLRAAVRCGRGRTL